MATNESEIRLLVRDEMQQYCGRTPEQHRKEHESFLEEIVPFIHARKRQIERREAMLQRVKEQVFLWAILATLAYIGKAVWDFTFNDGG